MIEVMNFQNVFILPLMEFWLFIYIFDMCMELQHYNLEEILDYLDTPQQILRDFYLKLIKFSKERKKKIKGLKLALHLMKVIVEDEEEFRT